MEISRKGSEGKGRRGGMRPVISSSTENVTQCLLSWQLDTSVQVSQITSFDQLDCWTAGRVRSEEKKKYSDESAAIGHFLVAKIMMILSLVFLLLSSSSRNERWERLFVSFRLNNCRCLTDSRLLWMCSRDSPPSYRKPEVPGECCAGGLERCGNISGDLKTKTQQMFPLLKLETAG